MKEINVALIGCKFMGGKYIYTCYMGMIGNYFFNRHLSS